MPRVDDTSDPVAPAGGLGSESDLAETRLAAGEEKSPDFEPDPADEDLDDLEDSGGDDSDGHRRGRRGGGGGDGDEDPEGLHPAPRPARRRNGLIAFAQGSWRELQRVQWPDQRQVVQATGVVIGFVIVAGAYLGLADWVATKFVNFIL